MTVINTEESKKMEELTEKLKDHKWRLNNLYVIRDERGRKIPFKLNEAQNYLLDNMWYMSLVVKARQLGITTFYTIFYLDQILFSENKIAGIIAHKEDDMKKIFRNKILFALENMEPWVKRYIGEPEIATANELVFNNGGNIFVALSTRSNTPNYLHISEYGYICAHTPDKADEILHGAINSVHAGQMVSIESTAEGREGHYYRLAMGAERKRKEGSMLTPLDFKIFFFPWWWDLRYTLSDKVTILKEDKEYFEMLQSKHGIKLSEGQQAWYAKKKETVGEGIWAQYPSTLDEAFAVTLEGAYYAKEMARVYQERRIGFFPVDPLYDVNVAWDLGMNDQNVLVFFQEIGAEIRFVDAYSNSGYGLEHYVNYIKAKGYRLGRNVLPHDVAVRDLSTGISREQFLWDLGMRNTHVVPKGSIQDGIEKVRQLFSRFRFNEETTKQLTDGLHNYRRDFDKNMGVWKSTPRHDDNSHICDAVRTLAMAYQETSMDVGEGGVNIVSFFH
jgi:hypothetical protein